MPKEILMPQIDSEWWQIAGNPDLGPLTSKEQQPVDFSIWQATDGTWQLWSCIRGTKCGGKTRLFFRWEGNDLTDKDWRPIGIAMQADPRLGETEGGLQAPHVVKVGDTYYMFYGDFKRICLAKSHKGKVFERVLNDKGQPDLFTGPYENPRDPMVLVVGNRFYCYYTGQLERESIGADFCRTSVDLRHWSDPVKVAAGGKSGSGMSSAECPYVVCREDLGLYYLFRTQRYGEHNMSTVYCSRDPLYFGVDDDQYRLGTLPIAAPEIVKYEGQYYIAALMPSLQGIRVVKLRWVPITRSAE